ncbi:hypothetical protein HaLaN_22581 [Haematococcus lacustris]|uniref:Uncharacterized protein n=1 Tax=Haematococcus lacustris TaxID=44745 RepID=A0A699ZU50_HAELA|nr:hypothetical protein HaLaN_22581 [Haematococcus lacustris]
MLCCVWLWRLCRLVVVLDLSYSQFPHKTTVDTGRELVDASIVNVACTRSERYLAVGVPASGASFYLNPALPGGKASEPDLPVVASWQAEQLPTDSFSRKLAEELHNLPGVPGPDELQLNQQRPTLQSGSRKPTLSVGALGGDASNSALQSSRTVEENCLIENVRHKMCRAC